MKRILAALFLIIAASMLIAVMTSRLPEAQTHTFPALDTNNAFIGANTFSKLNNTVYVDGSTYPFTAAGFLSAIAALPSTGGTVDATAMQGPVTFTATVNYCTNTQPIRIVLGATNITFTNTSGNGFQLNGRGCSLQGRGPLHTTITAGTGFVGNLVRAEPLSGSNQVDGISVKDLRLDTTGCPTCIPMNLLSVREPSEISMLQIRNFTGTTINVGISAVGGAGISQSIHFHDLAAEVINPKTADTVISQCDACIWGPNVFIASTAIEGTKIGLRWLASTNGDGRQQELTDSAIVGYATDFQIEGGTGAATQGSFVKGNWFENFNKAIQVTGPNGSNPAAHITFTGNFYLQGSGSGTPWVTFDFATLNTFDENLSGGTGTVQLTANSTLNDIRLRTSSANGLADITDAGTGNVIHATRNNGGIAQTYLVGQVQIARNNTLAAQWDFLDSAILTGAAASGIAVGNKHATPVTAGASDLGTAALPWGNLWLGTAATNNFKLQPAATAGARIVTMTDPVNPTTVGLPFTIASGTSTLTANATLAAVTSQAAITTAGTGILTTDAIEWSYASAPTAGDSLCHVSAYPTAGNVNFVRTNPTAASQNVSAIVINWRVLR